MSTTCCDQSLLVGRHQLVELVPLAVGSRRDAYPVAGRDDREQRTPDLARLLVASELVQEHVRGVAASGLGVCGQRGDARAAGQADLERLVAGAGLGHELVVEVFHREGVGGGVALDALLHRLGGLALAARENHPALPLAGALGRGREAVVDDLQRGGEGLPALSGEHADLESAPVADPALLVGVERDGRVRHRRSRRPARGWP